MRAVSGPTPQALALATVKADAAADALVGEMLQELKRRIEFKRRARSMRGDADGADGSSGDGPLSAEQQRRRRGHTRDDSSGSEASSFSTSLSSAALRPLLRLRARCGGDAADVEVDTGELPRAIHPWWRLLWSGGRP